MTALGFVHVMRADQHRDAVSSERVDLAPEVAARLRIDTGRRFVEQQQFRLVQQAGRESEALLPAARQRAGQLCLARRQSQAIERIGDALATVVEAVDARGEVEVFGDRQVFIQPEPLRHVANPQLDATDSRRMS